MEFDLISPADGEPYAPLTPLLEWETSVFAETYSLLVADDASFLNLVINEAALTGTTLAVAADVLQPETEYFWRVTASNSTGDTGASNNDFAFTVELTVKLIKAGHTITEIPITYIPRGRAEGKKIYWADRFLSLWTLIKSRYIR